MSFGHDDWLFRFLKQCFPDWSKSRLPLEALYVARLHSLYSWFWENDYQDLENRTDRRMKSKVTDFAINFDYYTKKQFVGDEQLDYSELMKYAQALVEEFFGTREYDFH